MPSQELRGEALLVLDSGLNVCAANRTFYELFRLAPEECIGRKVYELGGKSWNSQLRLMLESALVSGSRSDQFELIHDADSPGHGALWLTAKTLPVTKVGEESILLSIENLAAGRPLEDSLAAAKQELKTFAELAGRAAHELNNVLTVVRMNAELLQPELARVGVPDQEVIDIIAAAERAESLTRQLLVSSRRAFPQPTGLDGVSTSEEFLALSQGGASAEQTRYPAPAEETLGGQTWRCPRSADAGWWPS
jgi:signal transduction histidine kinase